MSKEWLFVTFDTEHEALHFSSLCKQASIEGRLMPIPRKLSAGCGIAWRSEPNWEQAILALMQRYETELSCKLVRL
ncbi:hypothetical protein NRIC_21220 [Enterococcus florum]|uniref:Putative Se/S carrier protein-like domain-containing protein n=1 Tax=Enterococcus florum TaxID=2480627 RepID=A0A4P5PD27_9ENTE|nr:DUF3343 domain-containing protein [Enterococcus florum]GCF94231.1 hypothetical protein NRIC_21220 [Enterococcus florum]